MTDEESLKELMRALARWAKKVGYDKPPDDVLAALAAVADEDADAAPAKPSKRELKEAGLGEPTDLGNRLARGRNDEKRVRGGKRQYLKGLLIAPPSDTLHELPKRAEAIMRSLLILLTNQLRQPFITGERLAALEVAWSELAGRPYGPPDWKDMLISQLEMDEHFREEERLRELHGDGPPDGTYLLGDRLAPEPGIGATLGPASGAEILAYLKKLEIAVPAELTADAIDAMRERTSFGGGGPGAGAKKKAKNVVEDFARALQKKARGNSRR